MPTSLPLQVLDHDPGENHEFRINGVKNTVVGEIEAVRDFGGNPCFRERSSISTWRLE